MRLLLASSLSSFTFYVCVSALAWVRRFLKNDTLQPLEQDFNISLQLSRSTEQCGIVILINSVPMLVLLNSVNVLVLLNSVKTRV